MTREPPKKPKIGVRVRRRPDRAKFCIKRTTVDQETIFVVRYENRRIYLLGTSHTDARYAPLVRKLIGRVAPQVVGVELCRTRAGYRHLIAGDDEQQQRFRHPAGALHAEFAFQRVPAQWRRAAVGEKLSLLYAFGAVRYAESKPFRVQLRRFYDTRTYKLRPPTRVGDDAGVCIGAELSAPFRNFVWRCEAADSKYLSNTCTRYRILLLDRPVQETYALMAAALSSAQKRAVKEYKENFERDFVASKESGRPSLMAELMLGDGALLKPIFVDQRDEYMAATMATALVRDNIRRMVCVIGRAHVDGVLAALRIFFTQKI